MKKISGKLALVAGAVLFFAGIFASCSVNVTVQANKNGSVDVKFAAGAGEAFSKMIESASGQTSDEYIDKNQILYELAKGGFSNVNIPSATASNFEVNLTDSEKKSYLFTTGIFSEEKGDLKVSLTGEKLKKFYDSADEQTKMVLDILLVPVFNDEEMSESEYLEMIGTVYGADVQKELQNSVVNLSLINVDGKKINKKIPMAEILTLNGELNF